MLHVFDTAGYTYVGFVVVFLGAFLARAVSTYHLTFLYEAEHSTPPVDMHISHWWNSLRETGTVSFSVYFALMNAAVGISAPFFAVYMLRDLELSYLVFMLLAGSSVLAQFLTLTMWGRIADIYGNRLILLVTSMSLPLMFFIQLGRGLTPTEAALLLVPMAVAAGVLSPIAGRWLDRTDPRVLLVPGLLLVTGSLVLYSFLMNLDTPIWMFLIPSFIMGVGNAGMWGPLATTAPRNLAPRQAGAGAGIYNTMRTIGSVLGSASIAVFMQARLEANLPGASEAAAGFGEGTLPPQIAEPFSTAMAQAILLPAAVLLIGVVAVLFLRRPSPTPTAEWQAAEEAV